MRKKGSSAAPKEDDCTAQKPQGNARVLTSILNRLCPVPARSLRSDPFALRKSECRRVVLSLSCRMNTVVHSSRLNSIHKIIAVKSWLACMNSCNSTDERLPTSLQRRPVSHQLGGRHSLPDSTEFRISLVLIRL